MQSDTLFLQSVSSISETNPNFANAQGASVFSNYSQNASASLTSTDTDTLIKSGMAEAMADAQAVFNNDENFSRLFTEAVGVGLEGPFEVQSNSEAKVIANFDVKAKQSFSFDFKADLALKAKEIEDPDVEYNEATSKTAFVVLDISDINKPKVLDYFGLQGNLVSTDDHPKLQSGGSKHVKTLNNTKEIDGNNDNGTNSVTGNAVGTYQREFQQDTKIAIVEINTSNIQLLGDTFIDNLGKDVTYGTIWDDKLKGDKDNNKIYGSLGKDYIKGKKGDDILEGGQGNDTLDGGKGNDKIHGAQDDDIIHGGLGSDTLAGGSGSDCFVFQWNDYSCEVEKDVIVDFEAGVDKIQFQGWCYHPNVSDWFNGVVSQNQLTNTEHGALLSFHSGDQLLFQGVNLDQLSATDFQFG